MKRLWKAAIAAVGVAVMASPGLAATPAGATPPAGYGFDNTSHTLVGGGSDTTYPVQLALGNVWNLSQKNGCVLNTAIGPDLGKCVVVGTPETNTLVNYQHDNISQAPDVGSSAGIAALNGVLGGGGSNTSYSGTIRTMPPGQADVGSSTGLLPDFARSSRGPRTSGGSSASGNELNADTFWGFAQDGLELTVFNARGAQVQAVGGSAITPNEIYRIYNCEFTQWSQIPSLNIPVGSANDGPVVAWGMNASAGTYATFNTFLINNGGAPAGFLANAAPCVKPITPGVYSIENDIKPIVNSVPALSTVATSVNNPKNWIWWGSFGAFSAYPATSKTVRAGTTVTAIAAPVNGILPSTSGILAGTYPMGRTLYHVTRKNEAKCPGSGAPSACNFTASPGPALPAGGNDLNVIGPTSGTGGAVREYTRFICRVSAAQQGLNPFTGVNLFSEVTGALNKSGFTTVPVGLRSPGSRCQVLGTL